MSKVIELAREAGFFGLEDRKTIGPWERFYTLARADLLADTTYLQGEVISLRTENAKLREALKLGLEYWGHRQKRYKNRAPVWVQEARAAIGEATGETK